MNPYLETKFQYDPKLDPDFEMIKKQNNVNEQINVLKANQYNNVKPLEISSKMKSYYETVIDLHTMSNDITGIFLIFF